MKKKSKNPKIVIRNLARRRIPKIHSIKKIIKKVLELEKSPNKTLSVTYVNDLRMKRLNRKYRGRNSSTDVLAFSMREGKHIMGEDKFLGDVVISLDTAERQAKNFKTTIKDELKLYLIHGILHLLGYDDKTKSGLQNLKRRERELFNKIN